MAIPVYELTDVISYKSEWLSRHPELPQTEGVLLVLDPDQIRRRAQRPIVRVRVGETDGSSVVLEVSKTRINPGGVAGLFLLMPMAPRFARFLKGGPAYQKPSPEKC